MRIRCLAILFISASILLGAVRVGEADWTRQPAFSASATALLEVSKAQAPVDGMPVLELLEDTRITFDVEGRRETRYRYVFRVDHEAGLDGWRTIGAIWKPWNQVRPELQARVITPDGRVHTLDPATIGESPYQDDSKVFDDRKRLAAPLPQLCVGALAEVQVVTRELAPTFPEGSLVSVVLQQPVPVLQTRVLIESPAAMSVKWKVVGLPGVQASRNIREGLSQLLLELGRVDPVEGSEPNEPAEEHPHARFVVSTVPSWTVVAKAYHDIVERQLAGAELVGRIDAPTAALSDPREKINRILQRLGRDIKYTGLEFGAASIIPRAPGEVLTRGYGDCKDKATLLVGTLRAAGIPAHVALLNTGPGEDLNDDLPGLNHFDHAIVHVPGPVPMWIDPTAELFRAGELPFQDQGRKALIAAPGTVALTMTPCTTSSQNLAREIREIYLADAGPGRIVETSQPEGLGEALFRSEFANAQPKQLKENLKKYAQGTYDAKDLGTIEMPDPGDLSRPFTLTLEALQATVATTYDFEASVTINPWAMTEKFRRYVPLPTDKEVSNPPPPRKHGIHFQDPYAVEWEYRIHPPAGFASRALPVGDVVTFGPASLSRSFAVDKEGVVIARIRFDSGKARWSAAEYEAARRDLNAFGKTPPTSISFDLTAEAHLLAGRIRDSIQEYKALVASRPGKAAPLSKLSMALLKGGMGELAREDARKACQLEPDSAYAQRTLGYVLLHDLVGREFQRGWDREGSIKAFREAKRLDGKDALTRKNLAIVLEYNEAGERYGRGGQLDQAIQEYQALRSDLQVEDSNVNLLLLLARTSRFKELEALVQALPASSVRSAWLVTAATLLKGASQTLLEAPVLVPDVGNRRNALLTAGDILVPLRRYQDASALLLAGAVGADNASAIRGRAALLAKARRHEEVALDPKAPATVVWSFMKAVLVEQQDGKGMAAYFSPTLWTTVADEAEIKDFQRVAQRSFAGLTRQGVSAEVGLDLAMALSQVTVDGDEAKGFRVRLQVPGADDQVFFVSRIQNKHLIAGLAQDLATLGIEAGRRLKEGDLVGARVWLDWARELAWAGSSDDVLSGAPFCRFWTKGQQGGPDEIRLAAASLQIFEKSCKEVPGQLLEARAKTTEATRLVDLDLALCNAYNVRNDLKHVEPLARRLLAAHPGSKTAARLLAFLLDGQNRWEELITFLDAQLVQRPTDLALHELKARALSALNRPEEKERLLQGLVDRGMATAPEFNNLAWARLINGNFDDQTLEFARRALLLKPDGNAAALHTLAAILAERGEVSESLELLNKMLRDDNREELRSEDWYVFARISEQFGERSLALDRYRKVTPPGKQELTGDSCRFLADRRVQILTSK